MPSCRKPDGFRTEQEETEMYFSIGLIMAGAGVAGIIAFLISLLRLPRRFRRQQEDLLYRIREER